MYSLLDLLGHYCGEMVVDKLNRRREEKNNQTIVDELSNAAQNQIEREEQIGQGLTPFTGQGQGREMLGWTQPEAGPEALATQRGTPATPQRRRFDVRDYFAILKDQDATATQRLQSIDRLYKLSKFVTPGQKIAGEYERYNRDTGRNEIVTYNDFGQETVAGESKHGEPRPLTEEEWIQRSTEVNPETGEPTVGAKNAKKILNELENRELDIYGKKKKLEEKYRTPPEARSLVQYWDEEGNPRFLPNNELPPKGWTRVPPERPGIVKTRTLNDFYKVQTDILRKYGGGVSSFVQIPGGGFEMTMGGKNAYQNMEENARGGNVQAINDLDLYNSYDAEINKLMSGASATNPNDPLEWRK